ncbi:DEAD/DEAH box helicase [Herbiconiux sp. SYSU D00978]|uniref:DEAD/DEAH box helicase n=1 Tax=Herbiconiux sp. SYSU D00978 TaxID=2812562 RepID=UPI001F60B9A6|nr:type ISP restriction/modification enzyme [Herbiconiux sp. SYSU D00978]
MTVTIHEILRQLRSAAYDERDKGDRFERLMQSYLSTEPQYAQLYDEVWMWIDYPERNGRRDTGIDLVARTRGTGELTAIQCKFFDPSTTVTKPMLDSFLAASGKTLEGKPEFAARMVISTSDNWGSNAEEAVENQNPPVARLRVQDLDESSIDWSRFTLNAPSELSRKAPKQPFPHQETAIQKVLDGFESEDRGKLIMACGTGKTFTSLNIVERMVPAGGTVLFLVPSIALLSQTLKEWTVEASRPLRSFAVCSDVSVGKRKGDEDTPVVDLAYPATTSTQKLVDKFFVPPQDPATVTVIFSTYQSIEVVAQAQKQGLPEFDLIVCDEAHRSTGVTLAGEEESAFVRVHDQNYVQGKKRLYMTATPRIYADVSRTKAEEAGAVLADMDNEALFGKEFHRLGFGEAVSIGRLTDYKVLVLAVDESYVSKRFQRLLADENNELTLDDAAKIVGCWNGLSKRALTQDEFALDPEPMKRAVAFARNIAESKKISRLFEHVVNREIELIDAEEEGSQNLVSVEAEHVDGTYNVLLRNQKLDWLKEDPGEGQARLLTNARCLSEGVDVPALDAVMFLNPRDSVVDVVQSVGRVMRRLEGKNYGYVVLPIGVPADVDPSVALSDNKKYRVVWQVLQALRAHDERFDAEVNKIDLTKRTDRLQVGLIGKKGSSERESGSSADHGSVTLDFPELDQWREAILAKIVEKVGERRYWENWAKDVAGIASDHITRIRALVDGSDAALHDEFARFLKGLQDNLNPFITERDAVEMLSQHLITKPVFDALFEGYAFSDHNPVSQVMQRMVDALEQQHLEKETERLDKFYDSVRTRAAGITDAAAKQHIVKELYEKFFQTAFSGTSDRLGIVYTPNEIVDFIIHSVDDALKAEFGASLSDKGVHVLDPFTGTGTFIVRLLQSGLVRPEDLYYKYRYELHANELVLLAYYVAAINIEATYHDLAGGDYVPFEGIVLTDTFQMNETDDELDDHGVFPENNERAEAQKALDIRVVIGNPPYSKGQESGNDNNQNLKYPTLDAKIAATYAARSTAQNKNNLYDSYIRAIRWASDRIGDRGIVSFVSNGGFIDGNTADGVRKTFGIEFSSIYVFNLRGNARTAGEQRRKEKDNVFGQGTRTTAAIYLLVKNPNDTSPGKVFYNDIGDYLTRQQKLDAIRDAGSYTRVDWTRIEPNEQGDWVNQRNSAFDSFTLLASKERRDANRARALQTYSRGLESGRDAWVYNYSKTRLLSNVNRSVETYSSEVDRWVRAGRPLPVEDFITTDSAAISWTRSLRGHLVKERAISFVAAHGEYLANYRPFSKQHVYFDPYLNHERSQTPRFFPSPDVENWGFYTTAPGAGHRFSVLAVGQLPDLAFWGSGSGQFFPRYSYEAQTFEGDLLASLEDDVAPYRRIDNVTDEILADYQATFGAEVTKDDIFFYLYGLLHSSDYREQFEGDLQKMLPRIPKVREFRAFSDAGRKLSQLHLDYEQVEPYPLSEQQTVGASYHVSRMRYGKLGRATDKSTIIYNSDITVAGIPDAAHEYVLGSRSAVDWVIERYQAKPDKASGIMNDPNDWAAEQGNPRYVLDLLARVVTVSVETVNIIKGLPPLEIV